MKTFKSYQSVELEEGSSDTTDMYALMVKGLKSMPGSPKQKEIIKQINVIRKRMGMKLMKEDFNFDEASKLPPHLAKFFDKKGNPKPEVAARMRKGARLRDVEITDVTPKGYGPKEELEVKEGWKKGKHKITDDKGNIVSTHSSGAKAEREQQKLMQTGDHKKLTVAQVGSTSIWKNEEADLEEGDDRRQRSEREAVNKISKKESEWAKSKRLDKEMENKYEKIHQERDKRYIEQQKNQKKEEVQQEGHKVKCPECKGKGCDHCDDKGFHIEEVKLEEMPNRRNMERINSLLKKHSGKFKWRDDTLHVEKGIERGVKSTLSKAKKDVHDPLAHHPTIKVSDNPMRENKNYKQFEKNKSNVSKKDSMKEVEKSNKAQAGIEEARKPYDIYHPTYSAAVQHAKDHTKKAHGFDVDQDSWDREVTFGQRKPSPGKTAIKKVNLTKDGKSVKKRLHMQVYGMDSGKYELNKYVEDYDGPIENIAKQILTEGNGLTKADIAAMAKKLRVPLIDIINWDHGPGAGGKEWLITLRGGQHLEYMEKSGIVKIPKAANPDMKAMKDYLKNMKSIGGEAPGKIADVKLGKNYLIGGLENAFKLLSR